MVLEGEGGAGDLKGDIKKSGLEGCEAGVTYLRIEYELTLYW